MYFPNRGRNIVKVCVLVFLIPPKEDGAKAGVQLTPMAPPARWEVTPGLALRNAASAGGRLKENSKVDPTK